MCCSYALCTKNYVQIVFLKQKHAWSYSPSRCYVSKLAPLHPDLTCVTAPSVTISFIIYSIYFVVFFLHIGAALGPLLAGLILPTGWNNVFYMLIAADFVAAVVSQLLVSLHRISQLKWRIKQHEHECSKKKILCHIQQKQLCVYLVFGC